MTDKEYQELRNDILAWLSKRLKPKRITHTLGVEETAVALARIWENDVYEASLAALLHDNAKNLDTQFLYEICQKEYPSFSLSLEYASVLHAFAGASIAAKRYPMLSEDIIYAICYHTTARPHMSLLEKIIYAADFAEPGRESIPGLEIIRERLFIDLEAGIRQILQQTVSYVNLKKKKIHPLTLDALQYYENQSKS
ncbi:MAG: HD domain-containing protein [Lachnospiraceae bacterium]|jgi:nicotinate-nucleotide adenylyltransferase|nr:HD domain-containing protein [Lachnospiraceae bacterium]